MNLKDNIWINGFDHHYELEAKLILLKSDSDCEEIIYSGLMEYIPLEILEKVAYKTPYRYPNLYFSYTYGFKSTAKDAVYSACNKSWCVIYSYKK